MYLPINSALQNGRYILTAVLGQGGFGITYKGIDTILDKEVCIKEFFMKNLSDRKEDATEMLTVSDSVSPIVTQFKAKFIKEAQIIASLNNSHIINIFDVFEENATAYYVMEYLGGNSLKDKVESEGIMNETEALTYILQLCEAVTEIHRNKIMHLDIKPSNIMLSSKGDRAVLIDFGISKHYDDNDDQTSSTPIGRSKGYAPIEQYNSASLNTFSPSTDIYSIGATLFYLLTGKNPPEASIVNENGKMVVPAYISHKITKVIEKAMMPRRKDRFQSIDELLKALGVKTRVLNNTNQISTPTSKATENHRNITKEKDVERRDWYMWMFFPLIYSFSKSGERRKNTLLSVLYHPLTLEIFIIFGSIYTVGSMYTKNLHDFLFSLSWAGFGLLCVLGFIGGILFPFKMKNLKKMVIPKWFKWIIFSMTLLSIGFSFDAICLSSYIFSPILWGIHKLSKKLNLKLNSTLVYTILSICVIALGLTIMLLFLLLLSGFDS